MAYDATKHFNNFGQNTSTNTHRATRNDIRVANNTMKPNDPYDNVAATTSTNIFVMANGCTVGMIQSFVVNESRQVQKLQAIGWEGVVQAVPANTDGGTLNITRIALYESSIWNALGLTTSGVPFNELGTKVYDYPDGTDSANWDKATHVNMPDGHKTNTRLVFKTLKDQRVPLEIQVKTRREGSKEEYYMETYIDCWIQSYSRSYSVGSITISDQVTVSYADVY